MKHLTYLLAILGFIITPGSGSPIASTTPLVCPMVTSSLNACTATCTYPTCAILSTLTAATATAAADPDSPDPFSSAPTSAELTHGSDAEANRTDYKRRSAQG
ncbi:hypothetical protein B0T14DRAFT_569328 [Immersiella caudata]|uniref:Uncharacterized protein n=1 Tax=Immersiella caudata TaxID=314043 RepID=A0AA39WD88_9PEZI|nr:hypothetical protein B0T14DRAFT_569328 [Immersiella caudata]